MHPVPFQATPNPSLLKELYLSSMIKKITKKHFKWFYNQRIFEFIVFPMKLVCYLKCSHFIYLFVYILLRRSLSRRDESTYCEIVLSKESKKNSMYFAYLIVDSLNNSSMKILIDAKNYR